MSDTSERYYAKRNAGISDVRKDGSKTSAETDRQAGAAERFAAEFLGQSFNSNIYATHGDGGSDFKLGDVTIEVIHLGMVKDKPRMTGNLIVNPHEPQRWAEIYIVVRGSIETDFEIVGWYPHETLISRDKADFGYGPRYCCSINELLPIDLLMEPN